MIFLHCTCMKSWSVCWNYGSDYEQLFFEAYGVAADTERIDYYRLLWDVGE